jgi:CheY-like chemotaxis protein
MGIPLRVLMIEDSEDDALLLARELRRAGYDLTHERVDTAAALEAALDRHPWDLDLGDYSMPQFSGIAALAM